jgi:hypothetical protein
MGATGTQRAVPRSSGQSGWWLYNRDRAHSTWGGRTPDEVYFNRPKQLSPLGRVTYFDGSLIRDAAELRKLLVLQEENPPGIAMRSWVG